MFGFGKRKQARAADLDSEAAAFMKTLRSGSADDVHAHAMRLAVAARTDPDYQARTDDPANPVHARAVHDIETHLGADMDGDGTVAGRTPDLAAQLERVAALHAAGQLTDAEFANLKARILG